jgi:hypothetical protein
MPIFFIANPEVWWVPQMQPANNQQYADSAKFANVQLLNPCVGLLRKIPHISLYFIWCKDTHFSQMSQAFYDFSSFARNIQHPFFAFFSQNPQNETLTKIRFFANDFISSCINKSKIEWQKN